MWTKLLIFFTLLFLSHAGISQSDSIKPKVFYVVKADVLFPVLNAVFTKWLTGSITGEVGFGRRSSFQFTFLISKLNLTYRKEDSFQLIPEYKIYLNNKFKHSGFYIGLYSKYAKIHSKQTGTDIYETQYLEYKNSSICGGIISGYQLYLKKRLTIELLVGIGIRNNYETKVIHAVNTDYVGKRNFLTDGRLSINIGYRF